MSPSSPIDITSLSQHIQQILSKYSLPNLFPSTTVTAGASSSPLSSSSLLSSPPSSSSSANEQNQLISQQFVNNFCRLIIEQNRNGTPINNSCLVELIHILHETLSSKDMEKLFQLFYVMKPTDLGLCQVCDLLREGGRYFPLSYHLNILKILNNILQQDAPPLIQFPGDLKSFVQIPSISVPCPEYYTLLIWIKLTQNSIVTDNKLFRCRSPTGGIECGILDYDPSGQCTLSIKSFNDVPTHDNDTIIGKIYVPPDEWHLLSFTHITQAAEFGHHTASIIVSVDSVIQFDHDLTYPFYQSPSESLWIFGSGIKCAVSTISLYADKIRTQVLSLIAEAGPHNLNPESEIVPQGSFDTGHSILGINQTKGYNALTLGKLKTVFTINSLYFTSDSLLPLRPGGKYNVDDIELSTKLYEVEVSKNPFLSGLCDIDIHPSWLQTWINIGGPGILLYLIYDYASLRLQSSPVEAFSLSDNSDSTNVSNHISCLYAVLDILSRLISRSVDAKDQFIQEHGFHVLSFSFQRLDKSDVNISLMNRAFDLIKSMQSDSHTGDGITSALQGLLFDNNLWEVLGTNTKEFILSNICDLLSSYPETLYRSIGVQRILDVTHKYCSHLSAPSNSKVVDMDYISLLDSLNRLLSIALDGALDIFQQHNKNIHGNLNNSTFPELLAVLTLLENTSCCEIAERLLRTVHNLRYSAPTTLATALREIRYSEVTILHLLCDSSVYFSTEVRRSALTLFLWDLQLSIESIPVAILQYRDYFNMLSSKHARQQINSRLVDRRIRDSKFQQLTEYMKIVEKNWLTSNILAEELQKSLGSNGGWVFKVSSSGEPISTTSTLEVIDIFVEDGPLGNLESIVLLPLLATFLPLASLDWCQRLLMALSVNMKTNDSQVATLSLLPDIVWIQHFLSLAVVGFAKSHSPSEDWASVHSFGEQFILNESAESDVARTCLELALDSLSQVMLYKFFYFGSIAWNTFQTLRNCLHIEKYLPYKDLILHRISSLCLQKLSRTTPSGWNIRMLPCLGQFINFIEEKQYCGKFHYQSNPQQTSEIKTQTPEERLLLSYLIEMILSFKRAGENMVFGKPQTKTFLAVFRIFIASLPFIDLELADRVCNVIVALLGYISEKWVFYSGSKFKDIVFAILARLKSLIYDYPLLHHDLRERYISLIMTIIQYFIQLRYTGVGTSPMIGVPPHILKTYEILSEVEGCQDVDTIFMLLHTYLTPYEVYQENIEGIQDQVNEEDEDLIEIYQDPHDSGVAESNHTSDDPFGTELLLPVGQQDNKDLLGLNDSHFPSSTHSGSSQLTDQSDFQTIQPLPSPPQMEHHLSYDINLQEVAEDTKVRTEYYEHWISIRKGIMNERSDTERARILRWEESSAFALESLQRYLKVYRRKIESETFLFSLPCEWKLGIANEGYFPSRKRVVLRPIHNVDLRNPQYNSIYGKDSTSSKLIDSDLLGDDMVLVPSNRNSVNAEELQMMLLQSTVPGVIVDITSNANEKSQSHPPGSGWGVIDADGSDEGFGVVGVAQDESLEEPNIEGSAPFESKGFSNIGSDMKEIEDGMKQGRDVNTGPCYSGTRRITSDPILFETNIILVTASGNYHGIMTFTSKEIYFMSINDSSSSEMEDNVAITLNPKKKTRRRRWLISNISAVYIRRYRLRDSALEVFFHRGKHRNFFIDFGSTPEDVKRRNTFSKELMKHSPRSSFKYWPGMTMYRLVAEHGVQQQWINGEISNFDYLMALNTLAGRSYNDLCQYPVMPWVIAQYTESTIDLSDPATYRDLSKPMGALNEERLESFLDRYESFKDGDIPPFMYGSHYSTMVGVVLHYLVRLQPFASLHISIQNGHFDVPDRLFSSIPRAWEHNTTLLSEVKELTPEWFTLPEFLKNVNNFQFGVMQNGEPVDNVELPPWASSPEEFIRINREALESEYVSNHLHEWIDLIFGYKQRGPQAIEAHNVFYYLTYYGAINRELITDEATKKAIEIQIAHFGQCPMELFRTPHPPKGQRTIPRPFKSCFNPDKTDLDDANNLEEKLANEASCTLVNRISSSRVIDIIIRPGNLLCILENGVLESYRYALSEAARVIVTNANRIENATAASTRRMSALRGAKSTPEESPSMDDGDLITWDDSAEVRAGKRAISNMKSPTRTRSQVIPSLVMELEGNTSLSSQRSPSQHSIIMSNAPLVSQNPQPSQNITRDVLIAIEKETTHFEVVPRIPLSKPRKQIDTRGSTAASQPKRASGFGLQAATITSDTIRVYCTQYFVLSYGRIDGGIAIREVSLTSPQILCGADYKVHRYPVTCISSDEILSSSTEVFCSCDISGKVVIWTLSRINGKTTNPNTKANSLSIGTARTIISRRPQRVFSALSCPNACCDVSWQMGIAVCATRGFVSIFSIERNERVHFHEIRNDILGFVNNHSQGFSESNVSHSTNHTTVSSVLKSSHLWSLHDDVIIKRIALCDDGVFMVQVEVVCQAQDDLIGLNSPTSVTNKHYIVSYSIHGIRLGIYPLNSPVTFLSCPARGSILILGHRDGRVTFLSSFNLSLVYQWFPHDRCLTILQHKGGGNSVIVPEPENAAVLSVRIGPNLRRPAVMTVSTSSGALYIKALPDFIRWEKGIYQSTLSQFVNAPLQAVRGTLQQAHLVAADAAGAIASNAKTFADNTFAKINKSNLFKGVGGFFGGSAKGPSP